MRKSDLNQQIKQSKNQRTATFFWAFFWLTVSLTKKCTVSIFDFFSLRESNLMHLKPSNVYLLLSLVGFKSVNGFIQTGGGGGSWTRVRQYSAFGSTCLVRLLFNPSLAQRTGIKGRACFNFNCFNHKLGLAAVPWVEPLVWMHGHIRPRVS